MRSAGGLPHQVLWASIVFLFSFVVVFPFDVVADLFRRWRGPRTPKFLRIILRIIEIRSFGVHFMGFGLGALGANAKILRNWTVIFRHTGPLTTEIRDACWTYSCHVEVYPKLVACDLKWVVFIALGWPWKVVE